MPDTCGRCGGEGSILLLVKYTGLGDRETWRCNCPDCRGTGRVEKREPDTRPCHTCKGHGHDTSATAPWASRFGVCGDCHGRGWVLKREKEATSDE